MYSVLFDWKGFFYVINHFTEMVVLQFHDAKSWTGGGKYPLRNLCYGIIDTSLKNASSHESRDKRFSQLKSQ